METLQDLDPEETAEWLDSLEAVIDAEGVDRAHFLLKNLIDKAREKGAYLPYNANTPYVNTIPTDRQPRYPGDREIERRISSIVRCNAVAMVVRANKESSELGGHIATFQSAATLYDIGFNHFWRAPTENHSGAALYIQGHSSPGIYARAFVEGRLTEEQLLHFRREVDRKGLSSYPPPWLMPDFWQFPTVSMGLGPMMAIYQARFMKYLQGRGLDQTGDRKVWCFVGAGEMDEPEALGAISLASRECLDNLIFVVNCNLQRLDGPVRGNGKIIQELEALLRGCGWNVIKVIWGRKWDELLARDVDGVLVNKMNSTVDGDFQTLATESGAYIREHFFGPDPRLRKLVEHLSDAELQTLPRGGHDYRKLYAAYEAATQQVGAPTAILAKTIKGWTLGPEIEARNATHQIKKMTKEQLRVLRDRLFLQHEIPDDALDADMPPYYFPAPDSPAAINLAERRRALGGPLPHRVVRPKTLEQPAASVFAEFLGGSGKLSASTTMAFARLLRNLVRDPSIGKRMVPIVSDEARTFGLEPLIASVQIYSPDGQHYTPVDSDLALHYAESESGQVLEEE